MTAGPSPQSTMRRLYVTFLIVFGGIGPLKTDLINLLEVMTRIYFCFSKSSLDLFVSENSIFCLKEEQSSQERVGTYKVCQPLRTLQTRVQLGAKICSVQA